ncbi:TetR/AcrR family transcriptional regulator [Erythrobacter sp. F6033]|uniref:TetR/AcrR family transcriptional regulator n=1 Tax=Erythrobacter sp. F6033 TaxID=2926401 RepID=UPI001FF118AE|nr:TetR/AcrR family transcriptional regulator [Erythrobacter sp. F6033]MCK0127553.1 TetR/AcrR family transcriptional regulator [Erythrobacter sp. F6033]
MVKTAEKAKVQRRYSPKIRRSMILDAAAEMVEKEGISQVSMERIAKRAEISKSLIYKYFDSSTVILRELLDRELITLRKAQFSAAENARTFEDMVRGVTKVYLRYIEERGLLIERLQSDPAISDLTDPATFDREVAVEYFAKIVHDNFDLPIETARTVTDISFGVPVSAGSYLLRQKVDMAQLEDITVSMIIGTINGVRDDYLVRKRALKR